MKSILFFSTLLLAIGCSNPQEKTESTETTTDVISTETPIAKNIDPVCKMERGTTWTEYHVTDGDTTWFCSETCKTAYVGNPAKYKK